MSLRWFGCPDCGGKMSKSATVCQHCGATVDAVEETTVVDWFKEKPKVQKTPQNIQPSFSRLLLFVVCFVIAIYGLIKGGGNGVQILVLLILCLGSAYASYVEWNRLTKSSEVEDE